MLNYLSKPKSNLLQKVVEVFNTMDQSRTSNSAPVDLWPRIIEIKMKKTKSTRPASLWVHSSSLFESQILSNVQDIHFLQFLLVFLSKLFSFLTHKFGEYLVFKAKCFLVMSNDLTNYMHLKTCIQLRELQTVKRQNKYEVSWPLEALQLIQIKFLTQQRWLSHSQPWRKEKQCPNCKSPKMNPERLKCAYYSQGSYWCSKALFFSKKVSLFKDLGIRWSGVLWQSLSPFK